jgi:hypothetical protein
MAGLHQKLTDLIKPFNGEEEDFAEWVRRAEMIAGMQGVKRLEKFIPPFFSRGAFAVYVSLSQETKDDYKKLKASMLRAFSLGQQKAYDTFVQRRLLPGESVDVYAADLGRLASLVDEMPSDAWIKCALVKGLPEVVRKQIIASCAVEQLDLSTVVEKARTLVAATAGETETAFVAGSQTRRDEWRHKSATCFTCGKPGHVSRLCPNRTTVRTEARESNVTEGGARPVVCYECGGIGHFARACRIKYSKNT